MESFHSLSAFSFTILNIIGAAGSAAYLSPPALPWWAEVSSLASISDEVPQTWGLWCKYSDPRWVTWDLRVWSRRPALRDITNKLKRKKQNWDFSASLLIWLTEWLVLLTFHISYTIQMKKQYRDGRFKFNNLHFKIKSPENQQNNWKKTARLADWLTDRPVADVEDPAVESDGPAGDDWDVAAQLGVKVGPAGRSLREGTTVQDHPVHAVHSTGRNCHLHIFPWWSCRCGSWWNGEKIEGLKNVKVFQFFYFLPPDQVRCSVRRKERNSLIIVLQLISDGTSENFNFFNNKVKLIRLQGTLSYIAWLNAHYRVGIYVGGGGI